MTRAAVAVDHAESRLLASLLGALPWIESAMREPRLWLGFRVRDLRARSSYVRVVSKDELVALGPAQQRFLVGLNAFDEAPHIGALHDHRFPLAVLPLAGDAGSDELLYTMPWEESDGSGILRRGTMRVSEGHAYAIEDCVHVRHAIHSARPHVSINLTDVSRPPTRENRLIAEPLDTGSTASICERVLAAWTRAAQLGKCKREMEKGSVAV